MRAPLIEIREKILVFRGAVESSLVSLQGGLRQRAEASAAREILELLIDTSHVVSKALLCLHVEKLIKELHSVPTDVSNGDLHTSEKGHLSNGVSTQHTAIGINLRETQSMLLERIASEMNRLNFYFAHAKNLPFIENMEKRIQNASSLLDTSLEHCFVDGLICSIQLLTCLCCCKQYQKCRRDFQVDNSDTISSESDSLHFIWSGVHWG